jgi:hypothetical protein
MVASLSGCNSTSTTYKTITFVVNLGDHLDRLTAGNMIGVTGEGHGWLSAV